MEKGSGWTFIVKSAYVCRKPCNLIAAWLVTDDVGAATATIYAGVSAEGRKIIPLAAAQYAMAAFEPPKALYSSNGIYVEVGSNVAGVLVEWERV